MRRLFAQLGGPLFCLLLVCLLAPTVVRAQDSAPAKPGPQSATPGTSSPAAPEDSDSGDMLTLFPHSETAPFWISGQANVIFQFHGSFPAKYSGPNSFRAE